MRRGILAALAVAIALCAAGCTDDDDDTAERPDRSRSPAEARKCLRAGGFRIDAGSVDVREDRDAPDHFVFASAGGARAEIAFYDDLARAKRFEPEIRERASAFDGQVERLGRATIVWLTKPSAATRQRVERCVAAP